MSEKIINVNEVSYDKDDIMKEIEKELNINKETENELNMDKEVKIDSSKKETVKSKEISKNEKINKILNNKNDLVKGMVLSEILGKPKGRR